MTGVVTGTAIWLAEKLFDEGAFEAIRRVMQGRAQVAKEILVEELRGGEKVIEEVGEQDEVAAMVFRYMRAAQEGAARLNLRLMAQVLAGQVQHQSIYAHEFLRWAELLAGLRREEIILATTLHTHWRNELARVSDDSNGALNAAEKATEADLIGQGNVFRNRDAYSWNMTALQRTGLVRVFPKIGGISYVPSGLMDELVRLTRIEDALREPHR